MMPEVFENAEKHSTTQLFLSNWYTGNSEIPFTRDIVDGIEGKPGDDNFRAFLEQMYCDYYFNGINGDFFKTLILCKELVGDYS